MLVMACGQAPPAAAQPTAAHSPSPVASTSAQPKPSARPSASGNGLSCRLPIATPDGQGAFITFPAAAVSFDPNAQGLPGQGSVYYDRAFSRWLPVSRESVAPDGASYAYLERWGGVNQRARLHVVQVANGGDRVYEFGTPGQVPPYAIVDFAKEGIYVSVAAYEGPASGLFRFDPASGSFVNVVPGVTELMWPVSGGPGVYWYADGGPDPKTSAEGFTIPARVERLTLAGAKSEPWFYRSDRAVRLMGADVAGHPIFAAGQAVNSQWQETVWLASSPSEALEIGLPQAYYRLIADSHGVWFGSRQGIYLYSPEGGLQQVSDQPGFPANGCF